MPTVRKVRSKGSRLRGIDRTWRSSTRLTGEPVFVEFTSRIREARRRALGGPPDEDEDWQQAAYERPAESRAAEIGLVVSLLTRADNNTLRKVRALLEDEVG